MAVDIAVPSEEYTDSKVNLYVKTAGNETSDLKAQQLEQQRRAFLAAPSFDFEHEQSFNDISDKIVEDENIPPSVKIDKEQKVRVVVLTAPCENNFTEKDLREWSLNFSRPTVVRNAFTPPDLTKEQYFLPRDTKLYANVGQVGHFQVRLDSIIIIGTAQLTHK